MDQSKMSSEKREIGRASGIMAFFTLVSRLLGLVRNQILSHFFGAGFVADAFIAAFTIPNALRRLFGEGALTPAIVALLTRSLKEPTTNPDNPNIRQPWQKFISNSFIWLTIFLVGITLLGILGADWIVSLYVDNFNKIPGKFELTVSLTRFLFPFILFIGWSAFFMGVLNTFRSFAISAAGPAFLNISVIILVPATLIYVLPASSDYRIYVFAGALLVGGLFQALIQLPWLKKYRAMPRAEFQPNDYRVKELGILLLPSIFSMGVYQLNIIVNRYFASDIPGAVSHLFYADLLLELPVSLIATSVGTAVVPTFSRQIADGNRKGLAESFEFSMEAVQTLALPSMLGLIVLSLPLVSTLYLSGKFTPEDAELTSRALIFYGLGLPFFSGMRIILPLFFAQKDTFTPAITGFIALGVNLLAAWALYKDYGASGIAFATSISSFANLGILCFISYRRFPDFAWGKIFLIFLKMFFAAAGMAAILALTLTQISPDFWLFVGISIKKIGALLALVILGTVSYFSLAYLLGIPHTQQILRRLFGRIRFR
ncbi:MAG: murein biosynthesis integral membrane protein MurJ [Deltaproteobacteria bacterium]|nr:murein biosynthesis integral membrane protein MurJ [Deltaproteobacteria bacterium]